MDNGTTLYFSYCKCIPPQSVTKKPQVSALFQRQGQYLAGSRQWLCVKYLYKQESSLPCDLAMLYVTDVTDKLYNSLLLEF